MSDVFFFRLFFPIVEYQLFIKFKNIAIFDAEHDEHTRNKKKHFLPYLKEEKPSNLRIITTFFDRNAYLIEANV